jgi:hydroxymethylglutaryl-CoA synthase
MDKQNIGIDDISLYIPKLYLPLSVLAEERNIEYAKLNKGLGLTSMAIPDVNEDAATMAANAVLELIQKNNLKPSDIGRLYLGTESALDGAKPTATYILDMIQQYFEAEYGPESMEHCDVLDMTFACIGAVDAMLTTVDWVRAKTGRIGIIVSSDFAKYDLSSTGEYTQGAGSIAMLIKENPRFITISEDTGVSTGPAHDFFKPKRKVCKSSLAKKLSAELKMDAVSIKSVLDALEPDDSVLLLHKDTPVFDGPFSNACYKSRVESALENFKHNSKTDINTPILDNWERLIFHLPYAFHAKRICTDLVIKNLKLKGEFEKILLENDLSEDDPKFTKLFSKSPVYRAFVEEKLEKSQRASSLIGNMYSCSIFLALISSFHFDLVENTELTGKKIGFLAYGSGAKSKVFEGTVNDGWKYIISNVKLQEKLDNRDSISYSDYEDIHRMALDKALASTDGFVLESINEEQGDQYGARSYRLL